MVERKGGGQEDIEYKMGRGEGLAATEERKRRSSRKSKSRRKNRSRSRRISSRRSRREED